MLSLTAAFHRPRAEPESEGGHVKKAYKIEINLTVETEHEQEIIARARNLYLENCCAVTMDGRFVPAEEFIGGIEGALEQLMQEDPAFDYEGIMLTALLCDIDESDWARLCAEGKFTLKPCDRVRAKHVRPVGSQQETKEPMANTRRR
jgi:hypothetical protein